MARPTRARTVAGAAKTGDRLAALSVLRDRLAREIDQCDSARDIAALSRQLTDVLVQIEGLAPVEQKGSPLDELAKRRGRRPGTAGSSNPKGRVVRGG